MKKLQVIVEYLKDVPLWYIKDYVQEAIQLWGGQKHPDDPLFYTTKTKKKDMRVVQ